MRGISRSVMLTVVISALGYFVDIYDLLLFGIVRMPSLKDLGVRPEDMLSVGMHLLSMQMGGMLLGGILWGVLGDLKGRKSVLFGSILMYSLANIANAFVPNVEVYGWLRFVAGVGLAGELGAAITLVSEVMSKEHRGYGTAVVASVGILGAVAASLIGDHFSWQTAYLVGGAMGLCLLALRAYSLESGLFKSMSTASVSRGQLHGLLLKPVLLKRYLGCILVGVPIWFVIGILITFAPELARELGVEGVITGSRAIMWAYVGLSAGDLVSGLVSQWLRSRKKAVLLFLFLTMVLTILYSQAAGWSEVCFYALCVALGFGTGYWAMFVTIAAEQFGTNIRATAATSVPNFVRGSVVPVTAAFQFLRQSYGLIHSALILGMITLVIAALSVHLLEETFGKDLDYFEEL